MLDENKAPWEEFEEGQFSLCAALCVEPDEMWRYDGVVYRVHENRRQFLAGGEWWPCNEEGKLLEILENLEEIERSGLRRGELKERLEELKKEMAEIERIMREWNAEVEESWVTPGL